MHVYALVGPSGTGKSHRAIRVAHDYEVEIIIDDGLIIKGTRILYGTSAKRQVTRIGAIKAALFMGDEESKRAREVIKKENPSSVLILGTSVSMVKRIAKTLDLPGVETIISIEDVASPKEIRKAKLMRSQYSKHVIPAPTVEVKKGFPDKLIDPLRVFLHRKDAPGKKSWQEQSVVRTSFTYYGKMTISQSAIAAIAGYAAILVEGVVQSKKVNIVRDDGGVIIKIYLIVSYGYSLDEVARQVQCLVKSEVEQMTGLPVAGVHVTVEGLRVEQAR